MYFVISGSFVVKKSIENFPVDEAAIKLPFPSAKTGWPRAMPGGCRIFRAGYFVDTATRSQLRALRRASFAAMPMNTPIRTLLFLLLSGTLLLSAPKEKFLVCIDPGHPSETSDGASANGLSENHLNWEVAQRLAARLKAKGIPFVVTKSSEKQRVTNRERAEIANGANSYKTPCTAFIRLHCDTGGGSGFMWYYPDRSGTKEGVTGPSHDVQVSSRRLAETMNEAMKPVLKGMLGANSIRTDAQTFVGGKQGGVLTGSIFSRVPTALIEMCFINSKGDAEIIASTAGQDKMADALLAGIEAWRASR